MYFQNYKLENENDTIFKITFLIDLKNHIYLNHHVFGGTPIVPGAFIMDFFIESITLLNYLLNRDFLDAYTLTIENCTFIRPIIFKDDNGKNCYIKIHQLDYNCYDLELYEKFEGKTGLKRDKLISTATISNHIDKSSFEKLKKTKGTTVKFKETDTFYTNLLTSHTSILRTIKGDIVLNDNVIQGTANFNNNEIKMMKSLFSPKWSPLLLDSTFQLAIISKTLSLLVKSSLDSISNLTRQSIELPYKINRCNFYRKTEVHENYTIICSLTKTAPPLEYYEIVVFDSKNNLVLKIDEFISNQIKMNNLGTEYKLENDSIYTV